VTDPAHDRTATHADTMTTIMVMLTKSLAEVKQVRRPLLLENDDRRISDPPERQVERESPGSSVSIDERVDALELVVDLSRQLGGVIPPPTGWIS